MVSAHAGSAAQSLHKTLDLLDLGDFGGQVLAEQGADVDGAASGEC
jgi:hypothetical protein